MSLLLSRTAAPTDFDELVAESHCLEQYDLGTAPFHRHWEYALALHAIGRWKEATHRAPRWPIYLLGGEEAFSHAAITWTEDVGLLTLSTKDAVEDALAVSGAPLADIVLCLSVLEHVVDLDRFLFELSCLVAPAGLLVLTFAYWNRCGADLADDHAERTRIFCPKTYAQTRTSLAGLQLQTFGGLDPTWHGVSRGDYTTASLVLEKRR